MTKRPEKNTLDEEFEKALIEALTSDWHSFREKLVEQSKRKYEDSVRELNSINDREIREALRTEKGSLRRSETRILAGAS